ncbi:hypothetical protein CRM22_001703 [Opisthorchis felineus]|uniref:ATP-dependent DNA helicase n=1 Tax=Opisthorchis felineus TaxID=147828 RepID=A0A4S2M9E3_OPIFE|nr:hypothetical protein CRM22_001703 [Opisthorchis felineus]
MSLALRCCVIVEELAEDKCTVRRRISLKDSKLSLVRDDARQLLLRLTPIKETRTNSFILKSLGYPVLELDLHKRFLSQGKATISLPVHSVRLLISNCPPDKLRLFLGTLRVKLRATQTAARRRFEPDAPPTSLSLLEEVSPLRLSKSASRPITPPDLSRIPEIEDLWAPDACSSDALRDGPLFISTPVRKTVKRIARSFSHVISPLKDGSSVTTQNDLQMKVVDLVKRGSNVFCTGGAGTGKSHLIRRLIGILPPDCTAVTASTGTAANLIGGTTIHAFSGIGALLSSEIVDSEESTQAWLAALRARLTTLPAVNARWRKIQHLIIDEISMLSSQLFTRLDLLARETRCPLNDSKKEVTQRAFGGLQVIVFGDFYQLPPVSKQIQTQFAFESPSWKACRFACVELVRSWRQSDDPELARVLSVTREGHCPDWARHLLMSRCHPSSDDKNSVGKGGLVATRLCTHRNDAEAWNMQMLASLPGNGKVFRAKDSSPASSKRLDSICPAPRALHLKVGAQVMLLRNLDTNRGLVNGARGVVERLGGDGEPPQVRFFLKRLGSGSEKDHTVLHTVQYERWNLRDDGTGHVDAYRRQLPLNLAWAVSVHKSQGITLDTAELALSKVFECGQAYVALSRCRTLSGLRLLDWRPEVIQANPKVVQFYAMLRRNQQAWERGEIESDDETSFSPVRRARRL